MLTRVLSNRSYRCSELLARVPARAARRAMRIASIFVLEDSEGM